MDWQQIVLFGILGLGAGSLIAGIARRDRRHVPRLRDHQPGDGGGRDGRGLHVLVAEDGDVRRAHADARRRSRSPPSCCWWSASASSSRSSGRCEPRRRSPSSRPRSGLLLSRRPSVSLAFGIGTKPQPPVLPGGTVTVFGSNVPIDRFILPGIVLAATLVLVALLPADQVRARDAGRIRERGRGDAGGPLAQPARSGEHAAREPSSRAPWACSPPRRAARPKALPLQVVPALTAALFARFTSFWIACPVGLAIGMAENILYYLQDQSWFPTDRFGSRCPASSRCSCSC